MANELTLPVTPGTLDTGFCPANLQEMLNGFSAKQTVVFPSTFAGVTVSATKPTDTTQAWLQLDSLGRPVRFYYFAQGAWLAQHPCVPGFTMIWTTTLPNFTTFDGGDANALSPISGPMWEVVTDFAAKFPIGAGTLPSTTVLAVGDTGGEEKHSLTSQEMPPHTHPTNKLGINIGVGPLEFLNPPNTPGTNVGGLTGSAGGDTTLTPPVVVAHQNLPPFFTVNFLRRTNRQFFVV